MISRSVPFLAAAALSPALLSAADSDSEGFHWMIAPYLLTANILRCLQTK